MAGTTAATSTAAAAAAPAAIMSIDSCDPKRMMFDSLDLLAHEVITNPSKRMERKGQLEVRHMCQTMCLHVDVENYVYRVWLADVMSGFGRCGLLRRDPLACGYWYLFHSVVLRLFIHFLPLSFLTLPVPLLSGYACHCN